MVEFLLGAVAFAAGSFLVKKAYEYFNPPKKAYHSQDEYCSISKARPETTFSAIRQANQEIEELRNRAKIDRYLHEKEQSRIAELEAKIDTIYQNYEISKREELLGRVKRKPDDFSQYIITPDKLNIIQYHVGETVIGKKCPACHKPMVLQFKRDKIIISIGDFFWACTGFYSDECRTTQKFSFDDTSLFTQKNKPERNYSPGSQAFR